jgi:hypothetical protein
LTSTSYTAINLNGGNTYKFKVQARNSVGYSVPSSETGILCARAPDAPVSVSRNSLTTTSTQIGITWVAGFNGASPIIDYRVSYNLGAADWPILASGVLTSSFIKTDLIPGATYKFRVESRNVVGYSSYSPIATILCAQVPDAPLNLQNN